MHGGRPVARRPPGCPRAGGAGGAQAGWRSSPLLLLEHVSKELSSAKGLQIARAFSEEVPWPPSRNHSRKLVLVLAPWELGLQSHAYICSSRGLYSAACRAAMKLATMKPAATAAAQGGVVRPEAPSTAAGGRKRVVSRIFIIYYA